MKKSDSLYVLEEISYFSSDPFTLFDLDLPINSYMIECTNTHNFEGENCVATITVEHTLGYDMKLFGYDMILFISYMILFFSIFKFQELSVMLVASLINFGVKNQVPQIVFQLVAGDLMFIFSGVY